MNEQMNTIEQLASTHLGKAGDGSIVKPYVTPKAVDASLLVKVPRELNRRDYGIQPDDFVGFDAWHAYEVSFLTRKGMPINCVAKIVYSSSSSYIVESKSLKLYLNSFNMELMKSHLREECITSAKNRITEDLSSLLNTKVKVELYDTSYFYRTNRDSVLSSETKFYILDDYVQETDEIEHRDKMELNYLRPSLTKDVSTEVAYKTSALRSNCRVTNQPDWGDIYIYLKGKHLPIPNHLFKFIVSMRGENHFHEEICECVFHYLDEFYSPEELLVACLYTRRGGIDINPVRASDQKIIERFTPYLENEHTLTKKTLRQ